MTAHNSVQSQRYTLTEAEMVKAIVLAARLSRPHWIVLAGIVVLVSVVLGFFARDWRTILGFLVIYAGVLAALFVVRRLWYLPFCARRQFRNYDALRAETTATLTEEGVRFVSVHGTHTVFWSNIRKWRMNDQIALIYPSPKLFHIIPSRDQAFMATLRAKLSEVMPEG